jgi:hypothetical protein
LLYIKKCKRDVSGDDDEGEIFEARCYKWSVIQGDGRRRAQIKIIESVLKF